MVFKMQFSYILIKMKKPCLCFFIFFLFLSTLKGQNAISLRWIELVPKFAYSFVPESGVPDEMWEDEIFLEKIEKAGLLINKNIIGKKIRIDGFMVPLEFDYGEGLTVEEFVLVPDAGMCIHVPPPPPNQMILVKMDKPVRVRYMYQPIVVEGILKNTPPIKEIYNSIYEIKADLLEDIDLEELNY